MGIGDEDIPCALDITGVNCIGALLEFETLGTTDSEGCEGQSEFPNGRKHEMEEDEVVHTVRPGFRGPVTRLGALPRILSLCLPAGTVESGCDNRWPRTRTITTRVSRTVVFMHSIEVASEVREVASKSYV